MGHYPDEFIDRLHLLWGTGFLSPGGPEEVRAMVRGIDLRDALVLDIGCGTGGPAMVLAREFGARVVCVDVEPEPIVRAGRLAGEAGVADRIEFRLVDPGPLPFEAKTFDVVFSKDALIHIPDKQAIYADIFRMLRPGGTFAASDWLCGDNAMQDPAFRRFFEMSDRGFAMATAGETVQVMRNAGFEQVQTVDRNAWYAELSAKELVEIEGPLRERIIEVSDRETYERWLTVRRHLAEAARSGGLRPTHLRGARPA